MFIVLQVLSLCVMTFGAAVCLPAAEPQRLLLYGIIETPQQHLRITFDLVQPEAGDWQATCHSLDQANAQIPVTSVQHEGNQWSIRLDTVNAKFTGTESENGEIAGQWQQGSFETSVRFQRVDEVPQDSPSEIWQGELNLLVRKLKLQFRLYELHDLDGKTVAERAYFDSLSEGTTSLVCSFSRNDRQVEIEVPTIKAKYTATLDEQGTTMRGTFVQGIIPLPLVLHRSQTVAPLQEKPPRPQTPAADPPYRQVDFEVDNAASPGVRLAGTLSLPTGVGPFPAAILISGSGPQDRDETIVDHKPFAVIADHLTRQGIAVFRYDDRGTGQSTGKFSDATSEDFASDAQCVFNYALTVEGVDRTCVGIVGHSEGAMLAPLVAQRNRQVAFIVMLAGPGVPGDQTLLLQSDRIQELAGLPAEERLRDQAMRREIFSLVLADLPLDQARQRLREIIREHQTQQNEGENLQPETIESLAVQFEALFSPWMEFFIAHDPAPALASVDCPVLGLWGEKDVQVLSAPNRSRLEEFMTRTGKDNYEFVTIAGLNHLLQPATSGAIDEYASIEITVAPEVLERLSNFVLQVSLQN
jgi:pimeloyl-ACP methyl ester carboxylesterase